VKAVLENNLIEKKFKSSSGGFVGIIKLNTFNNKKEILR